MVPHFHQLADIRKCETVLNFLFKLIGTKEKACLRKEFNSHRICSEAIMAAVSLFLNTNMTVLTSCENALDLLSRVTRSAGEGPVGGPVSVVLIFSKMSRFGGKLMLGVAVGIVYDRFCPICNSCIIEDEFHFLLHCAKYSIPREKFYNQIRHNFVDFN